MDMEISSVRPIAILASYLALAAALTISIVNSIATRHAQNTRWIAKDDREGVQRKGAIALFSVLAIACLGVTWFYMFSFFAQSYSDWGFVQSAKNFQGVSDMGSIGLGAWLRDSKLFKEAWAIAMASKARWWWTQQIFFWTTLWSFWMGVEGYRHKILSPYKYMLLGQIVAVSFATNLFFLAMLVSPVIPASTSTSECGFGDTKDDLKDEEVPKAILRQDCDMKKPSKEATLEKQYGDDLTCFLCLQFLILPGLGSSAVLPTLLHTPSFMPVLLIPHLLLFVMPLLAYLAPRITFCKGVIDSIGRGKEKLYSTIMVASIVLFGWSTYAAVGEHGWNGIRSALYSHPAVSSVGWDVIGCWVSWGAWSIFRLESS